MGETGGSGKMGGAITRYGPQTEPSDPALVGAIEAAL